MKTKLIIFFVLLTSLGFTQKQALFKEAINLYNEGKYVEAIANYQKTLDAGYHSLELYYNLANAYYKSNKIASSIYYYEKALKLNPDDIEVKNNLEFAKMKTIDVIDAIPETFVQKIIKVFFAFNQEIWGALSVIFSLLFMFFFLGYYYAFKTEIKKLCFILFIVCFLMSIYSLNGAYYKRNKFENEKFGIVFSESLQANSEPNITGENLFVLHEGTKVQILDILGEWCEIKLLNGKTGWILMENIKVI